MAKCINIIEKFKILFEIMYPDTKIDEQSKSNVENIVMKFPKELSDASAFISEFEVFIDFFLPITEKKPQHNHMLLHVAKNLLPCVCVYVI